MRKRELSWCRGTESNRLRQPFQGCALPVSYPGTGRTVILRHAGERGKEWALARYFLDAAAHAIIPPIQRGRVQPRRYAEP